MEDKQPIQEQIKELWEWCGFYYAGNVAEDRWNFSAQYYGHSLPHIDLNNLFKYAVPKLAHYELNNWCHDSCAWAGIKAGKYKVAHSPSPALALFWAIYEVIKSQ